MNERVGRFWFVSFLVSVFLSLGSIVCFIVVTSHWLSDSREIELLVQEGEQVQAIVLTNERQKGVGMQGLVSTLWITYEFTPPDGPRVQSQGPAIPPAPNRDQEVLVYYDPGRPERCIAQPSVVVKRKTIHLWIVVSVVTGLVMLGAWFATFICGRQWLRERRPPGSSTAP